MIRNHVRVRGASAVGASKPGDVGPFGIRDIPADPDEDDEQHDQDHDTEERTAR